MKSGTGVTASRLSPLFLGGGLTNGIEIAAAASPSVCPLVVMSRKQMRSGKNAADASCVPNAPRAFLRCLRIGLPPCVLGGSARLRFAEDRGFVDDVFEAHLNSLRTGMQERAQHVECESRADASNRRQVGQPERLDDGERVDFRLFGVRRELLGSKSRNDADQGEEETDEEEEHTNGVDPLDVTGQDVVEPLARPFVENPEVGLIQAISSLAALDRICDERFDFALRVDRGYAAFEHIESVLVAGKLSRRAMTGHAVRPEKDDENADERDLDLPVGEFLDHPRDETLIYRNDDGAHEQHRQRPVLPIAIHFFSASETALLMKFEAEHFVNERPFRRVRS